jgi:hypothetical protein
MKFLVVPESTRATTSALLLIEWMKAQMVIDLWAGIYTGLSVLLCLISANLIRWIENPQLLPFLMLGYSSHHPLYFSVLCGYMLCN